MGNNPIISKEEERELVSLLLDIKQQVESLVPVMRKKTWLVIQTVAVDSFLRGRQRTTSPSLWVATLRGEDLTLSECALEIEGAREQRGGQQ